MNIKQTYLALDACFAANLTPHLIGLHGIGKSAIIYQYAATRGAEVIEVRVGQMADAGDLVGLQEFVKCELTGKPHSTRHILPDWIMKLVDAIKLGKKFILFFDELNRGHKDLLQAIFEIVYDMSLKGVKFAKDFVNVVAASNPPTDDYAVLDFSDSAFSDRFVHIKIEPSVQEWLDYGRAGNIENSVTDFISEYVPMLENSSLQSFDLKFVKPSRRSWDRVSKILRVKADKEIELELIMGIVGLEPAMAFQKFRDTYFKSLKADEVLNSYKKVKKDIISAVEKGRTDMLGTLNEELGQMFKGMTGLTAAQADNLADLVHDLPIEHAYALAIIIKENPNCTMSVTGLTKAKLVEGTDGKLGMFQHKKFVDRVLSAQIKREEMKKENNIEAKASPTSVPF